MSLPRALLQILTGVLLVLGAGYAMRSWIARHPPELQPGFAIPWPDEEVAALLDVDGTIWAGGKNGVALFDRVTGMRQPLPGQPPSMVYVKALARDGRGRVWVAHADGIERWDGAFWKRLAPGPGLSLWTGPSGLWVGTGQALHRLDGDRLIPFPVPPELRIPSMDVLFEHPTGVLWVGSSAVVGGLWRWDGRSWKTFGPTEGLPHPSVNALVLDARGTLWAGTGFANQGGAARLENEHWVPLLKRDGLAGHKVRSLFLDREGTLHFGSEYDGLAMLGQGHWRYLDRRDGLAGQEIKAMLQDADGVYWLGTDTGLSRVETLSRRGRESRP